MLAEIAAEREQASAELDFERAAALHAQQQKVKAAAALADELVQPIPQLRAVIVQKAAAAADAAERQPRPRRRLPAAGRLPHRSRAAVDARRPRRQGADQRRQLALRAAADAAGGAARRARACRPRPRRPTRPRCAPRTFSRRSPPRPARAPTPPCSATTLAAPPLVLPAREAAHRRDLPPQRRRRLAHPPHPQRRRPHGPGRSRADGRNRPRGREGSDEGRQGQDSARGRPEVERSSRSTIRRQSAGLADPPIPEFRSHAGRISRPIRTRQTSPTFTSRRSK